MFTFAKVRACPCLDRAKFARGPPRDLVLANGLASFGSAVLLDPSPNLGSPRVGASGLLLRSPILDRRRLEFPALCSGTQVWTAAGVHEEDRGLVPDGPMGTLLVVLSTPSRQLFGGIGRRQEPVLVHALPPEPAVECEVRSASTPVGRSPRRNTRRCPWASPRARRPGWRRADRTAGRDRGTRTRCPGRHGSTSGSPGPRTPVPGSRPRPRPDRRPGRRRPGKTRKRRRRWSARAASFPCQAGRGRRPSPWARSRPWTPDGPRATSPSPAAWATCCAAESPARCSSCELSSGSRPSPRAEAAHARGGSRSARASHRSRGSASPR